jgi:hypothetical protein
MCPICIANMALVAADATSGGGGLTTFALSKILRAKKQTKSEEQNETARDGTKTEMKQIDHPRIVSEAEWLMRARICSNGRRNWVRRHDEY